jgi:hypothetical protein
MKAKKHLLKGIFHHGIVFPAGYYRSNTGKTFFRLKRII